MMAGFRHAGGEVARFVPSFPLRPYLPSATPAMVGPQPPAFVALVAAVAVALPFLFAFTDAPTANFWPVVASWTCVAALLLVAAFWPAGHRFWSVALARGLVLAAVVSSAIGLVQYFAGDVGLSPWIYGSTPGQAIGNLRQRNQQATLMGLGAWALLWWLQQWWAARSAEVSGDENAGVAPTPCLPALALPVALMACMAVGAAATASRTGALQWLMLPLLLWLWYRWRARAAQGLALAGLCVFVAAALVLPELLWKWHGVQADALFERFAGDVQACTGRTALWSNTLTLIAQKPWLGWGWGELGYAHYMTLFTGTRFCVLLDNAHNLPLHLAVELGLPAAVALLACAGALCLAASPWRERHPARQLAWGVLAIVGLHSLLEYPLWYGPFHLVCLLSVALLAVRPGKSGGPDAGAGFRAVPALAAALVLAVCAVAVWDYHRVSQLYKPAAERAAAHRLDPQSSVPGSLLFNSQREFAVLTTTPLTPESAARVHALARRVLQYSPEPRVIQLLIDSAALLGHDDEVAFHTERYRRAYPEDYERWRAGPVGASAAASR